MLDQKHSQSSDELGRFSPYDEEDVHTPEHPYCGNPGCWCHTNLDYHHQVTDFVPQSPYPVEQVQLAHRFLGIFSR
jgi:hypothetical protein